MAEQLNQNADTETGACCAPLDSHDLSVRALEDDVRVLSALANDTRYEVLRLLAATDDEVCACDFAPPLGVSQSAVSHALSALSSAGLVNRRKEGRWRYYSTTSRADTLLEALDAARRSADE